MANEKRLIDANELIRIVREQAEIAPESYPIVSATLNAVAALAKDLTTVDAVEVVRCKDCKHLENHCRCRVPLGAGLCNDQEYILVDGEDDFCSYGERREDNA